MTGEALSSRPPASKTLHGHAGAPLCWGYAGLRPRSPPTAPKRCKRARESRFRREARERGTWIRGGAPLKGVRLHDDEDPRPAGPEATQDDPEGAVAGAKGGPLVRGENGELLPEGEVLEDEVAAGPQSRAQRRGEYRKEAKHGAGRSRSRGISSTVSGKTSSGEPYPRRGQARRQRPRRGARRRSRRSRLRAPDRTSARSSTS